MVAAKKPRKVYRTYTKDVQIKLIEEFSELWRKGYDTNLILLQLSKKYFKSKSRVDQLVKARQLTKKLTRNCDVLNNVNL